MVPIPRRPAAAARLDAPACRTPESRTPEPRTAEPGTPVEELLRDLGGQLRRGGGVEPEAAARPWPTGLRELDRLLGGGFPRGRLSEITGPVCGGRTSLGHALLARATAAGEVAALVEVADAFDPGSAHAAGTRLERVLWVRAPERRAALRSVEHLLLANGFGLVLLDLAGEAPARTARPRPRDARRGHLERTPAVWPRLRKAARAAGTALVVLGDRRCVGACADLAVETGTLRPRFTGTPPLLEGLEGEVHIVRNRLGPQLSRVPVRWPKPSGLRSPSARCARPAGACMRRCS